MNELWMSDWKLNQQKAFVLHNWSFPLRPDLILALRGIWKFLFVELLEYLNYCHNPLSLCQVINHQKTVESKQMNIKYTHCWDFCIYSMLEIMGGFVTFFFYFLETVFDVCLIYVEENLNNQTGLWQNNTGHVCLYVCMYAYS